MGDTPGSTTRWADDPWADLLAVVRSAVAAAAHRPALIGIAGGVGVGKSTMSEQLADALSLPGTAAPGRPRSEAPTTGSVSTGSVSTEIVSTDGFLRTNDDLAAAGLLDRKGYPDTYDQEALFGFVRAVRAGNLPLTVPLYSHVRYDVVGESRTVAAVDVVVIEGLTVLQSVVVSPDRPPERLGDLLDLTIYVDADEADTRRWWLERFLRMRDEVGADPESFLHDYAGISDDEARVMGDWVWSEVNEPNLLMHIEPSRRSADVIVRKGPDHRVADVEVRRGPIAST